MKDRERRRECFYGHYLNQTINRPSLSLSPDVCNLESNVWSFPRSSDRTYLDLVVQMAQLGPVSGTQA